MQKDQQLLRGLNEGSEDIFNFLFDQCYEVLLSFAMRYLLDKEESKEIVQEAFVKLWEIRKELSSDINIKSYLYTIVKNNCLNRLKHNEIVLKNKKEILWKEMQYRYEALDRVQYGDMEFEELKLLIEKAIEKLPEHCKRVFILKRFEDLKYKEIAKQLNISEKTVEYHMNKAIKLIKEDLSPYLPILFLVSSLFEK